MVSFTVSLPFTGTNGLGDVAIEVRAASLCLGVVPGLPTPKVWTAEPSPRKRPASPRAGMPPLSAPSLSTSRPRRGRRGSRRSNSVRSMPPMSVRLPSGSPGASGLFADVVKEFNPDAPGEFEQLDIDLLLVAEPRQGRLGGAEAAH